MNPARQTRVPATLLAAVLVAAISLSGAVRETAAPIPVAIPDPFAASFAEGGAEAVSTRRWLRESAPLAAAAPAWAERLYTRSLLVLHRLTDPASVAMIAGARDGWNYVWPRDAAAGAIALAAAGRAKEARQLVGFLSGLDLDAAARFEPDGDPVLGRAASGDARGWVNAAARAVGEPGVARGDWRGRQDYGENVEGDLLGNAIAAEEPAGQVLARFETATGSLAREPGGDALDSAAAWAVVPFNREGLRSAAQRTLLALTSQSTRYGIAPMQGWARGEAWTAPTAWSAWALVRLGERRAADRLLAALHRSETAVGTLPERVSTADGRPLSTTPLAWSHAFAILALLERYPAD